VQAGVRNGPSPMNPAAKPLMHRFSVSLREEDFEALRKLAEDREPRLTVNYAVQYAVRAFLDAAKGGQLPLDFNNPAARGLK
jgi:hypothetical protein